MTVCINVRYNVHIMRIKNIISLSEARKRLFDICEEVQEPDNFYVLTKHGKPVAVIMSADDFDVIKSRFDPDFKKRQIRSKSKKI